jgi:hypothetical protein
MPWTFMDYRDAGGTNVIHDWLHGKKRNRVRADMNAFINLLSTFDTIPEKYISARCPGAILELRIKIDRVQYRPLCFYGPVRGRITLLLMAIEKNDRLEPPNACASALQRKNLVAMEPGRYCCDHDFS